MNAKIGIFVIDSSKLKKLIAPFTDFIPGDVALQITFEFSAQKGSFLQVFGCSALHAGTPHSKTGRFHFAAHELNHFGF